MIRFFTRLLLVLVAALAYTQTAKAQTYKLAPLSPGNVFVSPGTEPQDVTVKVTNWGNDAVTSFAYTLFYTDTQTTTDEKMLTLGTPLDGGETTTVEIPLMPGEDVGKTDVILNITKVNGTYNQTSVPYAYITRLTVRTKPVKRVLVEEWTGMWCQYCTKGLVIMQVLERCYGDRFIGVAIHDGDKLATYAYEGMKSTYGTAFPSLWVGRKSKQVDVLDYSVFENELNVMPLANIDVKAQWDADSNAVRVTANVEAVIDVEEKYAIAYVLTANGLQHSSFTQKNNYDWYGMEGLPPEAAPYVSGDDIAGQSYDEVAIASLGIKGGLEGSLAVPLEANVPQTHTATFENIGQYGIVSNYSKVKDRSNLRVVAILINTETNEVVNAAQCAIGEYATGIGNVTTDSQSEGAYDLSGRRVKDTNAPGIYLINGKKIIKK